MALYRARRIDWIKKKIAKDLPPAKAETTEDYSAVSRMLDTHRPFATRVYSMLGLLGEAGEFAKEIYKGNKDGIVKEGGDLLYYIAEACADNDVVFEDLIRSACEKMASKYPNGYR